MENGSRMGQAIREGSREEDPFRGLGEKATTFEHLVCLFIEKEQTIKLAQERGKRAAIQASVPRQRRGNAISHS